jgi:hypothetical protein
MSMVTEAGGAARAASTEPPTAAAGLAARERFDRALAEHGRDATAPERLIVPGQRQGLATDASGVPVEAADGQPAAQAEASAIPGWELLDAVQREADDAALEGDRIEQTEQAGTMAADPALLAAAGVAALPPASGAPGHAGDGSAIAAGEGISGIPGPVAAAGAAAGATASQFPPASAGVAQEPLPAPPAATVHGGAAAGQPSFDELVARYRESFGDGAGEIDGAVAGGWIAGAGQPLADPSGPPAATGTPDALPAGAARMAEFLLRQVPLAGSPGDPVSMTFPDGSGPIDQIVFMRDPGGLYMVVSSQPGSRDAVQRGLGELERRLRERGIAVGGIRLAEPLGAPDDRGAGARD